MTPRIEQEFHPLKSLQNCLDNGEHLTGTLQKVLSGRGRLHYRGMPKLNIILGWLMLMERVFKRIGETLGFG